MMRRARLCLRLAFVVSAILAGLLFAQLAHAQSALEWAASGMGRAPAHADMVHKDRTVAREWTARSDVQGMIAQHVTARIGSQWVGTALRIAKIESRFRCNARNGRAVGIFQNTNPAMFGVSRAAALTCDGGIRAGVAHMHMCIGKGARTQAQMYRCHNSGSPWGRVERAYRVALARL